MGEDSEADTPLTHLLLYALARLEGRSDLADAHLQKCMALWRAHGDASSRQAAKWFQSDQPPDIDAVRYLEVRPADKRVIVLALGARFPDRNDDYRPFLDIYNYDHRIPYLSIQAALKR